jgi:SAM-dependent methyltransferase
MTNANTNERVERERASYNGGLRRSTYERLFQHCNYHYQSDREKVLQKELRCAADADVLELGSQMWFKWLDRPGIIPRRLVCINISERELDHGRSRVRKARLSPEFRLMDAHRLDFDDDSFDVVYGGGILHHLDLPQALGEIARVLRPNGKMIFIEPLDFNPVARLVRMVTPFARTADERPFRKRDITLVQSLFDCSFHFEQFLSVPAGVVSGMMFREPDNLITRSAYRIDRRLSRMIHSIGLYYRYVILIGRHRAIASASEPN